MPTIAGMPAEYLKTIMAEFKLQGLLDLKKAKKLKDEAPLDALHKEGVKPRPSTIMGRLAVGYSEEQTALMADFFAKQKWASAGNNPMATRINKRLVKKGKKLARKKCKGCHEARGIPDADDEDTPRLGGQWLDYLMLKMADYKNPDLTVPQPSKMAKKIKKMSAKDLQAIAHFYAAQKK